MCFNLCVFGSRLEGEGFLLNLLSDNGRFILGRHSVYYRPKYHLLENENPTFGP